MAKSPPLTKRKRTWAKNRNVTLRGYDLRYNAAVQQKYQTALTKLVKDMTDATRKQVTKLFEGTIADKFFEQQEQAAAMDASLTSRARMLVNSLTSRFTALFSYRAKTLSEQMINASSAASKSSLHSSLKQLSGGLSLKTGIVPKGMTDVAKALVAENVSLIKSIPEQYFKDITGSVMRSITTGNGLADLTPAITKYEGQTKRRARKHSARPNT